MRGYHKMNIGIIGLGVVGTAIKYGFEKLGHAVISHDIKFNTNIKDIVNTEVVFICVPSPADKNGQCDTTIVHTVLSDLDTLKYCGVVAIKSTVSPGTTDDAIQRYLLLNICFIPEFLRERCASTDFMENHDLLVIGVHDNEFGNKAFKIIKKCHGKYPAKVERLLPKEAEFVKYFNNIYNATLITFANSFYEVCKASKVDYSKIKNTVVKRNHINDIYLDCNDNFRGFGGMCLPKDTQAINNLCQQLNLDVNFFKMLLEENNKYPTTVYKGMRK